MNNYLCPIIEKKFFNKTFIYKNLKKKFSIKNLYIKI